MIKPKISVIVPIYKAEKYIERCCNSLFGQTLDRIEYIFVDDQTPDNSINLIHKALDNYPNRSLSVKFITNQVNKGVAYSRQKGLESATGEFVIHCDSDDWLDLDAYEVVYNCAIQENADVVRFGYTIEYSNGCRNKVAYTSQEYRMDNIIFNISPRIGSVWGGLIRRKLFDEYSIKFPQCINWGEDFCVSIASLLVSKKTICLPDCFYHYWQNAESITHNITKEKCLELIRIGEYVENFLKSIELLSKYAFQLNYLKFQSKAVLLRNKQVRDQAMWRNIYPECNEDVMMYDYPLYFKVIAWLVSREYTCLANFLFYLIDIKDKS